MDTRGHSHSGHHSKHHKDDYSHGAHSHTHGSVDPNVLASDKGIWAIKWSFVGLFAAALLQIVVALFSSSIALLADTIHNFGDAATAIPLWIAFTLEKKKPNKRYTYGYGRVEDLAGVLIVLIILASAVIAGYESIHRLIHPQKVEHLLAVVIASIIGFASNEAVAIFRIRTGKEIGSAALIADGNHARVDGFASLAVFVGAIGIYFGFPLADPIIGLLITILILKVVWESGASIFTHLLDGVAPEVPDEIQYAVSHTKGVAEVTEIRVRWLGHRLHAELNIAVDPTLSVEQGHEIALEARHNLLHHLRYLSGATIHIDPESASGEYHHHIVEHTHDNLPAHSH